MIGFVAYLDQVMIIFVVGLIVVFGQFQCLKKEQRRLQKSDGNYDRQEQWESIRIQEYYLLEDADQNMLKFLQTQVIPNAIQWYQNVLYVKRLTDNLKVDNKPCEKINVPLNHSQVGINADLLVYIELKQSSDSILGWAEICQQDKNTGQPVVGLLRLETKRFEELAQENLIATVLHELTHIIAFSSELFEYWITDDGQKYKEDEMFLYQEQRNKLAKLLTTPKVKEFAKKHFNCNQAQGVELEDSGIFGSVGSHWEKYALNNEFMVADNDLSDIIYSNFTLAALEDSGWYKSDYSFGQNLQWGKNQGCDFLNQPCIVNGQPTSNHFCNEKQSDKVPRCDHSHLNKGYCDLIDHQYEITSQYRYFNDSYIGGANGFLDFCPIVRHAIGGSCRGIENQQPVFQSHLHEEISLNSRCVELTMHKSIRMAGCFKVECIQDGSVIYVGNKPYLCPFQGGDIKLNSGVLHCPKSNVLCQDVPCVNNCNGLGKCVKGICECFNGMKGGDCIFEDEHWLVIS